MSLVNPALILSIKFLKKGTNLIYNQWDSSAHKKMLNN